MKKKFNLLFIILILSITHRTFAQSSSVQSSWVWAKTATGEGVGRAVCTDISGNVYVTGFFSSPTITFGTFTLINIDAIWGTSDIFIVKYNTSGTVLWAKSAGGNGIDAVTSISVDVSGNIYVTGYYNNPTITFGNFTLTNTGGFCAPNPCNDIFIAKYDSSGAALWAKTAGGNGDDYGTSISADVGGNSYITGYFRSPTIAFGSFTLTNASITGGTNIYVVKYNVLGNVLWAKSAGVNDEVSGYSLSTDALGNVYVTGEFNSPIITFGSFTLINSGSNFYVVKYDTSGNVLWAKSAGGNGFCVGSSISADSFGNVYITGDFHESIIFGSFTLTNTNPGNAPDTYVVKYDGSGNVLWAKSATGNNSNIGHSISADALGNAYVTGIFLSNQTITFGSITITANFGIFGPMFIVKFDANGNSLCASLIQQGGNNTAVSADNFGNAYVTSDFGVFPFILGPDTLTPTGTGSVFTAKYTCCTTPTVTAIASKDTICKGASTVLNAGGATNYFWNPATGLSCVTCPNPVVSPATTATYTVTGTIIGGCSNTAIGEITVNPKPNAHAGSDVSIVAGNSTTLTATGGGTYLWNNGDTNAVITVSPALTTNYCVRVMNTNTCSDTACVEVIVNCGDFVVPNAFSPNDDGHNDLFVLHGWEYCISKFSLMIYDRWGEKVFESEDPTKPWDGKYQGKLLDPAVFVYYISASLITGEKINRKGNISLIL